MLDHTTSHVEIQGCRYYVQDVGTGDETVLLLHGWPDDGTLWRYQVKALSDAGYRVICPDMLGYGQSDRPQDLSRYTFVSRVEDLLELLDYLGVAEVHCIAHDYGSIVGWDLAATHPNRLKTYTALSVGHLAAFLDVSHEAMRHNWIYLFNVHHLAPAIYRANAGQFLRSLLQSHPDVDQIVSHLLHADDPSYISLWERANPLPEYMLAFLEGRLPEPPIVKVPTLGIWSSQDDFLLEAQMKNSDTFVEAEWRYERIEGANHWFMLERPEETNRLLLEWLNTYTSR